jgi:hypothetical protein
VPVHEDRSLKKMHTLCERKLQHISLQISGVHVYVILRENKEKLGGQVGLEGRKY